MTSLKKPKKENKESDLESKLREKKYSIDESPELYDIYSELNLFLSKKIKNEMQHCGSSKKWTVKIQEELIEKITPEFRKKFPQYRLGGSALKKAWEKIAYYSQHIPQEKEAIDEQGNLKPYFLIRENLKYAVQCNHKVPLPPKCLAHQIAIKISECLAVVNGEKVSLDSLTKTIWSMQQHLIPKEKTSEENILHDIGDPIDRLIIKIILESIVNDPEMKTEELKSNVKQSLLALRELPFFSSIGSLSEIIAVLIAEKLSPSSCYALLSTESKSAIHHFIQRHIALYKEGDLPISHFEWVRRIRALYQLGLKLPKDLTEKELKGAVLATYPSTKLKKPNLPQSVYAFISAELLLMRSATKCHCQVEVLKRIWAAYQEVILLPNLNDPEDVALDLLLWNLLSHSFHLLEKLSYRLGLRIDGEIAQVLIENPRRSFSSLVQLTVESFQKIQEVMRVKEWEEIEKKIDLWAVQGDLLCRLPPLDQELCLLQRICQHFHQKKSPFSHDILISKVCQEHLEEYPELTPYARQLSQKAQVLYKCAWYTLFSSPQESAYERFLKWHATSLSALSPQLKKNHLMRKLEEIVHSKLPLIPFGITPFFECTPPQ